MKAKAPINGTEQVNQYLQQLEHPLKAEIEAVRAIILQANPKVAERVKWNAPSFYYQKDIAVIHVREQRHIHVVFVFYDGNMINNPLLEGNYNDRRMAYFYGKEDIQAKKEALEQVINEWIELIENAN